MGYVLCAASDTSMYCNLSKMFNVLSMFIAVLFIIYFAYNYFSKKTSRKSNK